MYNYCCANLDNLTDYPYVNQADKCTFQESVSNRQYPLYQTIFKDRGKKGDESRLHRDVSKEPVPASFSPMTRHKEPSALASDGSTYITLRIW
jgi:hypothetical protein